MKISTMFYELGKKNYSLSNSEMELIEKSISDKRLDSYLVIPPEDIIENVKKEPSRCSFIQNGKNIDLSTVDINQFFICILDCFSGIILILPER